MITAETLKKAKFKAVIFGDGANGAAWQQYACEEFPEVTITWSRESRRDKGTRQLFVGELEVPDLQTMAEHINALREKSVSAPGETDG